MELPEWLKEWGPGVGGGLGGMLTGGWIGSSIGSIFGEDTWFASAMGWIGSIAGGIGGWLLGNAVFGRDPSNTSVPAVSLNDAFTSADLPNGAKQYTARQGGDLSEAEKQQILDLIPEAQRGNVDIDVDDETITLAAGYTLPTPAIAKAIEAVAITQ